MSTFEVKVYVLKIEPHPNADLLELAIIGDYRSVVRKGQYRTGDLAVYIPAQSVVPEWMLKKLGLWDEISNKGKLAGSKGTRVKETKLRGILSEGLIYPVILDPHNFYYTEAEQDNGKVQEGDDVTMFLGITKYQPHIPVHMSGEVWNAHGYTISYDIENFKKFPEEFQENEYVVMTEKLHGTWACFGIHPDLDAPIVTSKGLSSSGLALKINENNANNLYVKTFLSTVLPKLNKTITDDLFGENVPFYILGEIYGKGVQDLDYGTTTPEFRVFDIYVGEPGKNGHYIDASVLPSFCFPLTLEQVPLLYAGLFSKSILEQHTNGKETVSNTEHNIREGVVIKPITERHSTLFGRVILKSVSEQYLLRKGNTTEFN